MTEPLSMASGVQNSGSIAHPQNRKRNTKAAWIHPRPYHIIFSQRPASHPYSIHHKPLENHSTKMITTIPQKISTRSRDHL